MTFSDLLEQVAFDSDDASGDYRTAALRWLNLARSHIASSGLWRTAIDADVELTTSAATTTGLYILSGYDHLVNDWMYDETNDEVIEYESFGRINALDSGKDVTGNPKWWGDAGVDSNGFKQIYLWPIPDGTFTIRYAGYKTLTDITGSQSTLSLDPFFGNVAPWGSCFAAGMRYYHDLNTNEDPNQIAIQRNIFMQEIAARRRHNDIARASGLRLMVSRTLQPITMGRFNPAHFDNK